MKTYYTYRCNRYGIENTIKTPLGQMNFPIFLFMLNAICLSCSCLVLDLLPNTMNYIGKFAILIYLFVFGFRVLRKSCLYASKDKLEIAEFISNYREKNNIPCSYVFDIISDDTWYLVYLKKRC